ncbi:isochorismatase family protein family [Verticillium dahliae VdLs.17]|uniref:Isochorismatase family protein family n=1 Tax=Verticillium dahliae (strain VdLs.17 / ATCC MYA-4575 / FGSC 10137) TaxID=498257 RepID=G2X956_VERDV|nr:isochorismatase family protein family [Verticillium dahliae VdLs.17]EGY15524.1 isochorismatase family protein family [Verticillium dahliae VdLs.17]
MFPFDQSALPSLPKRKALLVIDFQSDFLDAEAPLRVTRPHGFVEKTVQFADAFRQLGDVIWVCSEFDKVRPIAGEQILATDETPKPSAVTAAGAASGRRRGPKVELIPAPVADTDPEAFLSAGGIPCVRSPSGSQIPGNVKDASLKRDVTFIKSHYSAFKSGQLIHLLRGKFITHIFIAGSLMNIGVFATALDAAMYGYDITIVEDCCGYRSQVRQGNAIQSVIDVTGCEVDSSSTVLEQLRAEPPSAKPAVASPATSSSSGTTANKKVGGLAGARTPPIPGRVRGKASTSDLHEKLAALKIGSTPGGRIEPDSDPNSLALEVDPDAQPSLHDLNSPRRKPSSADDRDPILELEAIRNKYRTSKDTRTDTSQARKLKQPRLADMAAQNKPGPVVPARVGKDLEPKIIEPEVTVPATAPSDSVSKDDHDPATAETSPETSEPLCEGDTVIIHNVLPPNLLEGMVACPFYRDGNDYISEHSDKTLDIVKGSYIVNVSLGAERTMIFRTKRDAKDPSKKTDDIPEGAKRNTSRKQLPHNSLCRMGLVTNMRWLHAIRQDKRAERDKTAPELAFAGGRISLTFRQIGTFLDRDGTLIWGQGATGKTRADAHPVVNGQGPEAVAMLRAFGTENHASEFDWDAHYGQGFDVLHMSSAPRLFFPPMPLSNMRVQLALAEYGILFAKGRMPPSFDWKEGKAEAAAPAVISSALESLSIKYVDNDADRSTVQGDMAILLYLDSLHGKRSEPSKGQARILTRFQQGLALLDKWRAIRSQETDDVTVKQPAKPLKRELIVWNDYAAENESIAGEVVSIADFVVWPVLHDIVQTLGEGVLNGTKSLKKYYQAFSEREATMKVLAVDPPVAAVTATQPEPEDQPAAEAKAEGGAKPAAEAKAEGGAKSAAEEDAGVKVEG